MPLLDTIKQRFIAAKDETKEKSESVHTKTEQPSAKQQDKERSLLDEKDRWFQSEGKITIDLFKQPIAESEDENELVLRTTIGGITPDDIEITIQGDIIALKGVRPEPGENTAGEEREYYHQECYWGPFSRQIILPEEIDPARAKASLEEGLLVVRAPCLERERRRTLEVQAES